MSEDIYDHDGVVVTRFVGPASKGRDRVRWQLNVWGDGNAHTELERDAVLKLGCALVASAYQATEAPA